MKRKHITAAIGLAVVMCSAAATSTAGAGPLAVVPLTESLSSTATPGDPPDVADNYSTLIAKFFEPEPDSWGGAYVDGDVLVIKTVRRTVEEATALLAAAGVDRGVRVVTATRSIADLDALTDRIASEPSSNVVTVGPQYATSSVVVGVLKDDLAERQSLAKIDPEAISTYLTSAASTTSRYYDTSPFYGGAQIVLTSSGSTGGRVCSSGFSWNAASGTTKYMVTAGHCYYENNATKSTVNRVTSSNSWIAIGSVSWSSMGNTGTLSNRHGDLAVYALSGSNTNTNVVYTGTYNTTANRIVTGYTVLPEGWQGGGVYTSGAGPTQGNGTGEVNLNWISLVNQTVTYTNTSPDQVVKNLTVGENSSTCTGSGDSGGAVYKQSGTSNAYAMGIISGTNNSGGGTTNCRNYFTPITYVSSDFGGTLKTSP